MTVDVTWWAVDEATRLVDSGDRIELKTLLPGRHLDVVTDALGTAGHPARSRRVYFLDTPSLALSARGVIVRVRRFDGGRDDSIVRLRRPDPVRLAAAVRRSANLNVEADVLPGSALWSATLRRRLGPTSVRDALRGRRGMRTLFSAEQRDFFRSHAGPGRRLDRLRLFGPVDIVKTVAHLDGLGKVMVEHWGYPDGSRLLEISVKCRTTEAGRAAAGMADLLAEVEVEPRRSQQTKTRASLEYFSHVRRSGRRR